MTKIESCRVAVVTGAARGIGAATARALAADGLRVVAVDRDDFEPDADGIAALRCDLTGASGPDEVVAAAVERFGRIDVLVNNAAVLSHHAFTETPRQTLRDTLAVNLEAPFALTQAVVARMIEQGDGGAIVNVTSINAFVAMARLSAYSVAKAGIVALTRAVAAEAASHGIRCNAVAPGPTRTRLLDGLDEEALAARARRMPLGRLGEPADAAAAIAFLASPDAAFITGQVVAVDGGFLAVGA